MAALPDRRTRLRLVVSGISALDLTDAERTAYLEATTAGWDGGLPTLADYAARLSV